MEETKLNNLEFLECLYKGNGREVVLGKDKKTNQKLVWKIVNKNGLNTREMKDVLKEAQIMKSLRHKNIIGFQDVFETKDKIIIGNFFVYLNESKILTKSNGTC